MDTDAQDTRKSSPCPKRDGGVAQLSELAVAVQGILTGSESSNNSSQTSRPTIELDAEAVMALILLAVEMRAKLLSGDARWLALHSAKGKARKMDIPEEVVLEVALFIETFGKPLADADPISGMFQ